MQLLNRSVPMTVSPPLLMHRNQAEHRLGPGHNDTLFINIAEFIFQFGVDLQRLHRVGKRGPEWD